MVEIGGSANSVNMESFKQQLTILRQERRKADASVNRWDIATKIDTAVAMIALAPLTLLTGCDTQQLPPEIPPRDFDTEAVVPAESDAEKSLGSETVYDENLNISLKDLSVKAGNKPAELLPVLTVGYTDPQWRFRRFQGDPQYLGLTSENFEPQDAETMAFGNSAVNDQNIADESKACVTGKCMAVINPDPSAVLGVGDSLIFPRIFIRVGTATRAQVESIFGNNETWKDLFSNSDDDTLIFKEAATIDDVRVRLESITASDLGLEQAEFEEVITSKKTEMEKIFTDHLAAEAELLKAGNPSQKYLRGTGAGNFVDTAMTLQAPYYFNPDFQWRVYAYADKDIVSQVPGGPQGRMLDPDVSSMRWWAWTDDKNGLPGKMWASWSPYTPAANYYNTMALISGASMEEKHAFFDGTGGTSLPELPENWPVVPDVPQEGVPQDGLTYYNISRNTVSGNNANGFAITGRDHGAMIYAAPGDVRSHRTENLHVQASVVNTGYADPDNMKDLYCSMNFFQQNTE